MTIGYQSSCSIYFRWIQTCAAASLPALRGSSPLTVNLHSSWNLVETHLETDQNLCLHSLCAGPLKDDGLKRSGPLGQPLTPPNPAPCGCPWPSGRPQLPVPFNLSRSRPIKTLIFTQSSYIDLLLKLLTVVPPRVRQRSYGDSGSYYILHHTELQLLKTFPMIHKKLYAHLNSTQSQCGVEIFVVYLVCLQPGQCHSKPWVCHRQRQVSQHDAGA